MQEIIQIKLLLTTLDNEYRTAAAKMQDAMELIDSLRRENDSLKNELNKLKNEQLNKESTGDSKGSN